MASTESHHFGAVHQAPVFVLTDKCRLPALLAQLRGRAAGSDRRGPREIFVSSFSGAEGKRSEYVSTVKVVAELLACRPRAAIAFGSGYAR